SATSVWVRSPAVEWVPWPRSRTRPTSRPAPSAADSESSSAAVVSGTSGSVIGRAVVCHALDSPAAAGTMAASIQPQVAMSSPRHAVSLTRHLIEEQRAGRINADLRQLIAVVARACTSISIAVGKGALGGVLGANAWGGHLAACASEEMDHCHPIPDAYPRGNYLLLFAPLDGSSNIDVNVSVGTIFSVLRCPEGVTAPCDADFLQPGTAQVA